MDESWGDGVFVDLQEQEIPSRSAILKEEFDGMSSYPPSESVCADLSMKVMLPVEEIKIWLDHLHTIRENRKKGALKAAETRRRKITSATASTSRARESEYQCGICHAPYQDFRKSGLDVKPVIRGIILLA